MSLAKSSMLSILAHVWYVNVMDNVGIIKQGHNMKQYLFMYNMFRFENIVTSFPITTETHKAIAVLDRILIIN